MKVSRRSFLRAMVAVGASSSLAACGSSSDEIIYAPPSPGEPTEDLSNPQIYWTTGHHNCGGTAGWCVSKLHVVNGRIVRNTTDDSDFAWNGTYRDRELWHDQRRMTCTKCKVYKWRSDHPGRVRYCLKQTKKRGDMSGFIRVDSETAMKEIARKVRKITVKYGTESNHDMFNSTFGVGKTAATIANPYNARNILASSVLGGGRAALNNYSFHQIMYANGLTGMPNIGTSVRTGNIATFIVGCVKNIVSWGGNGMATGNSSSWHYQRSIELMKERYPQAKVYHISPELVDTGITCATDWVRIRNYTDTALVCAMVYHLITNTFDRNGNIRTDIDPKLQLDADYIDTFVYGFFDSPQYWVDTTANTGGAIAFTETAGWRKVNAVPDGQSWSAYIMGNDDRLTKAKYSAGTTYYAKQFEANEPGITRNKAVCAYPVKGIAAYNADLNSTKYIYKKELLTPKSPEWAEAITGVPAAKIRELAELYANPDNHPIATEWSGAFQKQDNGVANLFAVPALMAITKTFNGTAEAFFYGSNPNSGSVPAGTPASGTGNTAISYNGANSGGTVSVTGAGNYTVPGLSCTQWYNTAKVAFLEDLKRNGYTGNHMPEWDINGPDRYCYDEGGAKAAVLYKRNASGALQTYVDPEDGLTYADWVGRDTTGTPVYSGTRILVTATGGISLNQHMNTNETAEMYRSLPLNSTASEAEEADRFLLVHFDIYMSPSARYADYMFPCVTQVEASNYMSVGGYATYVPPLGPKIGESKDGWRYSYEAWKAQAELGGIDEIGQNGYRFQKTIPADAHFRYVKTNTWTKPEYVSNEFWMNAQLDSLKNGSDASFAGKTKEEICSRAYKPVANPAANAGTAASTSTLWTNIMDYLASPTRGTTPFAFRGTAAGTAVTATSGSDGTGDSNIAGGETGRVPQASGKFHVYNGMMVWRYENKFSYYHGWLPKNKRGQANKDYEGDPFIFPIPTYYHFEDRIKEAYGIMLGKNLDWDMASALTFGTTHDRYRSHSALAENPFLREMTHRTAGGGWASGNDWNEYAIIPKEMPKDSLAPSDQQIPAMLSTAIAKRNGRTASWHEVWVNEEDAGDRGIKDGDLIQLENPIGKVRVIARVTKRCIKGHINLHQGSWYDPNPVDGVDDGGCANTLCSSKPTLADCGNSQQWGMVTMKKVLAFF